MITIRQAKASDSDALAQIFFDAVRIGAAPKYSEAARIAWAPARPDADLWAQRLAGLMVWVAEVAGLPVGFMALRGDRYLDLAFVAPDWRGKGVGDALLQALTAAASRAGIPLLTTHASHMARSLFLRHDWQVDAAQFVERGGQQIANFRMHYRIS